MILDMIEYAAMMKQRDISIIYSGPMWGDGIKGIADMVQNRLAGEDISANAAKIVFSVFVEQITNVLMYSAEKERFTQAGKEPIEVSSGTLVLGSRGTTYFIQTGNAVTTENMELIKSRIEHLNSLDKKELRKYHKERLAAENDNPESRGAGLGLIEIARRATAPISYTFMPQGDGLHYFTMCVEIGQERREE